MEYVYKCRTCGEKDQSKFHHRKTMCDSCFEKKYNKTWVCPVCGSTDLTLKEERRNVCKKCRGKQSWEKEISNTLAKNVSNKKAIEKLFIYKG